LLCVGSILFASQKSIVFNKVFGGDYDDVAKSVVKTDDGYMIVGKSKSFTDNRDFGGFWCICNKTR